MPIYQLENIPQEFFTAQHSTAYGRLIPGTQVEIGCYDTKLVKERSNMPILMSKSRFEWKVSSHS
jgi:hypothetical protein